MTNMDMATQAGEAAKFLKQLAHPTRLLVLCALADKELSVGELIALTNMSQSALSQHLAKLREHQLVTTRRKAQVIYYRLANQDCIKIIDTLQQIFCPK